MPIITVPGHHHDIDIVSWTLSNKPMPKSPERPMRNQLTVLGILFDGEERSTRDIAAEFNGLARSSAYAALAMLQKNGYISARWDVEAASQPTRQYKITAKGEAVYEAEQSSSGFGRSATTFAGIFPFLLMGDVISGTVAGLLVLLVPFLASVAIALFGKRIVELRASWLAVRYPLADQALKDFVHTQISFGNSAQNTVAIIQIIFEMGTIAKNLQSAESNPSTVTQGLHLDRQLDTWILVASLRETMDIHADGVFAVRELWRETDVTLRREVIGFLAKYCHLLDSDREQNLLDTLIDVECTSCYDQSEDWITVGHPYACGCKIVP